jgi:hypothetical protein
MSSSLNSLAASLKFWKLSALTPPRFQLRRHEQDNVRPPPHLAAESQHNALASKGRLNRSNIPQPIVIGAVYCTRNCEVLT